MKITDKYVFFWHGIFSNWHLCKIIDPITGTEFTSTEQAFMWYKADFFRDYGTRKLIEQAETPKEAKALGRNVIGFNEEAWAIMRYPYMAYVNLLKYEQNEDCRKALIDTGNRVLVEASPYDIVWGIGLAEDDPDVTDMEKWRGANLLGFCLTTVRINFQSGTVT